MTALKFVKMVGLVALAAFGVAVFTLTPQMWELGNQLKEHGALDGEFAVKLYAVGGGIACFGLIGFALFGLSRLSPRKSQNK